MFIEKYAKNVDRSSLKAPWQNGFIYKKNQNTNITEQQDITYIQIKIKSISNHFLNV